MKTLTERQSKVVRELWGCLQRSRLVTVTDLVHHLGVAGPTSLAETLQSIERKGYVVVHRLGKGQNRFLELTSKGIAEAQGLARWPGLPVFGQIPAGPLAEAVQDVQDYIDPGSTLHWKPGDFFLEVDRENGESMRDVGIHPGSFVLLRPDEVVQSGKIVAALHWTPEWDRCDATLKVVRFVPGQKTLRLEPCNEAYEPLILPVKSVTFAGVYHGCFTRAD